MLLTYDLPPSLMIPKERGHRGLLCRLVIDDAPLAPIAVEVHPVRFGDGQPPTVHPATNPPDDPSQIFLDPRDGAPEPGQRVPENWDLGPGIELPVYALRRIARAYKGSNYGSALASGLWSPGQLVLASAASSRFPPLLRWLGGELHKVEVWVCTNPACDCRSALLLFAPVARDVDPQAAAATVDLVRATVRDDDPDNFDAIGRARALELLGQPDAVGDLWEQYNGVRETAASLWGPFRAAAATLRADDRCPCGSRKVYRRCCGQLNPPPVPLDLAKLRDQARTEIRDHDGSADGFHAYVEELRADLGPGVPDDIVLWYALYGRREPDFTLADVRLQLNDGRKARIERYIAVVSGTPVASWCVDASSASSVTLHPLLDDHPPLRVAVDRRPPWALGEVLLAVVPEHGGRPHVEALWRLGVQVDTPLGRRVDAIARSEGDPVARLLDPARFIRSVALALAAGA
jgi:hypothetical protein